MRWLVGWSSAAVGQVPGVRPGRTLQPVGAQLLWGDPDPLWIVGDWRTDEVRIVHAENGSVARLAVLGRCAASDADLRVGLFAARGGALRHLTAWAGSYTCVLQIGRRITVLGDLAGARPVFHTQWARGTAYGTAALPLADLTEAALDVTYLAALLACPDSPEALGEGTPYAGVRRVPPGHALIMRDGVPEVSGYEPTASLAVAGTPAAHADPDHAIAADTGRTGGRRPDAAGAAPLRTGPRRGPRAGHRGRPVRGQCLLHARPARRPACPGCRAHRSGTAPPRDSACWRSPSTTSPRAASTRARRSWNAPAAWPPTPGCTTSSCRADRSPCRTPTSTAGRSPTSRAPR